MRLESLDVELDWDDKSLRVECRLGVWRVDGVYRLLAGQYELAELHVFPDGEARQPIDSTLLREVRISDLRRALREQVPGLLQSGSITASDDLAEHLRGIVGTARAARRRALPAADVDYARWAADFVAIVNEGCANPRAELARRTRQEPEAVRKILERCRQRGLLTSPGRGRSGGALTAKASDILGGGK